MNVKERLKLLQQLGAYLLNNSDELEAVKEKAERQNPWFVQQFIKLSISNIANEYLDEEKLQAWADAYSVPDENNNAKTVGIVMAGNIPLVGFHDFLSVFVSGNKAVIKASSKDEVLIKHIIDKLIEWDSRIANYVIFAEQLKSCDAYIATGSNNTSRYFEYYFGKYPNIIRRNRSSAALLNGDETAQELEALTDDIQLYFGMGCRNVSKLYVPTGYDFMPMLDALKKYSHFADFHKYKNNYDYQLALLIMNNKFYMTEGTVLLTENESIFSPISQVHFEYYDDAEKLNPILASNNDIQCIIGKGFIPFGQAQSPSLTDYADGADTMRFLAGLR